MRRSENGPRLIGVIATLLAAGLLGSPGRADAQSSRRPDLDESTTGSPHAARPSRPAGDAVEPGDDRTFRPTVVIRMAGSQGSGTLIASTADVTLVLTAAHVVRGEGPIAIELHRYNLGLERKAGGAWPLIVPAEVVASDPSADVAVLRLRRSPPLPYVARLYEDEAEALAAGTLVTSLGVDLGSRLTSWKTKVVETARFQLENGDVERPFLITLKIPEHGRSGGGLFTREGRLAGVCVGHAEMIEGRRMGVFASIESVRGLLRRHDLAAVVSRSSARSSGARRGLSPTSRPASSAAD
ncbi:serine protease [Planctomyces sp. SH-PL62]|uniref:S1 family peptidase n=1 Tax=Planctomyces sp. SH-PL62 TaxID=1636152 RepID=UPI00078D1A52|nr:serine protease [Planctomyces sp. SH-PL62]AMV36557.1 Trypsin [Planctomyces sp. SH-PL62]